MEEEEGETSGFDEEEGSGVGGEDEMVLFVFLFSSSSCVAFSVVEVAVGGLRDIPEEEEEGRLDDFVTCVGLEGEEMVMEG